jgi:hypothetical protein
MPDLVQSLEAGLFSEAIGTRLAEMLGEAEGMTAEGIDRVRTFFEDRRDSILSSLRDVVYEGDEAEAIGMLPSVFLELRFEWNRYNAQMQYQTMILGTANPELMLKGAAIKSLIDVVELNLEADAAYWVTRIAADPIGLASARGLTMGRLLGLARDARQSQHMALEHLNDLGREIARAEQTDALIMLRTAIDRAEERMVTESDRLVSLRSAELQDIFELLLVEKLSGRRIPVLFHPGRVDDDLNLSPEVVTVLRSIVAGWLDQIFEHALEATVEERAAGGKSYHLNLTWRLSLSEKILRFELEDDGLGTQLRLPDVRGFAHLRLQCTAQFHAGRGGHLSVVCEASNFSSFMVCSIERRAGAPLLLAFFINSVVSIMPPNRRTASWLPLLALSSGVRVPIVELAQQWPNLDLAAPGTNAQYLLLRASRHGEMAWRMDHIHGQIRGVIMERQTEMGPSELIGYLETPWGLALVIDPDQMTFEQVSAARQIEAPVNAA